MLKKLKITTATFICLAFIFRLLFINVSLTNAVNSPQSGKLVNHFTSLQKRKIVAETVQSHSKDFSIVELLEERTDTEEQQVRLSVVTIFSVLHSFISPVVSSLFSVAAFDNIKCNLFSKRYLSLSVIRI
jgi:hypothetical protein